MPLTGPKPIAELLDPGPAPPGAAAKFGSRWVRQLGSFLTGPVVPAYEVETLFQPFRRLHRDRIGGGRGFGLGLSIVRAVARAHGGDAQAQPRPGGGLTVTVTLPTAPALSPA